MAMAFNAHSNLQQSVNAGGEVAEITTEQLGFKALGHGHEGPPKLKLLPSPWPSDNLPPASATLLSVASRRGLVAAASPDAVVLTTTENVRKALDVKIKDQKKDVISDFKPELTIPSPRLRHLAFTSDEDYLVLNQEGGASLLVYAVDDLVKGNTKPGVTLNLHDQGVRAILPCPDSNRAHYMAIIGDAGRLDITDITTGDKVTIDTKGKSVTCGCWSVKGKAYVVGFTDGSAAAYQATDTLLGTIPRPPDVDEGFPVTNISYLTNDDFFMVHSPPEGVTDEDAKFHFVKTKFLKNETPKFKDFTYHNTPNPLVWPCMEGDAPERTYPPRYSVSRLRGWEPVMNDMLIVASAFSSDISVLTNTKEPIAKDQEAINEFQIATLDDHRKAQVPRQSLGEDLDSVLIGEALDLSSTTIVERPSGRLEEVDKSPTPLPAYFILTHEGLLQAYWIIWDQSLAKGTGYPGLTAVDGTARLDTITVSTAPAPAQAEAKPNPFATGTKPAAASSSLFGQPSAPGAASGSLFGKPSSPAAASQSLFGKPSTPGATSTPLFGQPSAPKTGAASNPFGGPLGSTSAANPSPFGQPAASKPSQATFGQPGFGATSKPQFGAPTTAKPSQPAFGATGFNSRASPWAANAASSTSPFAAASGAQSGFAGFANKGTTAASPFGSGASPFGGFGGGSSGGFSGLSKQSSSFAPTENGSKGPSFTSNGSTLSSFGSFGSAISATDAKNRERDEATPTPAAPLSNFKLGSTFQPDGTAKDDNKKPSSSGGSFFGNDFGSALSGTTSKLPAPATPKKNSQNASTTPATQPKQTSLFSFPSKKTPELDASPKEPVIPEEAPLPPDPMTYKAPKMDDDLPPIAGSPPVQVEAPSLSVPSSPLEDTGEEGEEEDEGEESGFSEEEEQEEDTGGETGDDGDENVEPSPSDAARRSRSSQSANISPPIYPAAPTPPPGAQQFKPMPSVFGQDPKASPLQFAQSAAPPQRPKANQAPIRRDPLSQSVQYQSQSPPSEPEFTDLVGDEDERIRRELASDVEPSRQLDSFIARREYDGAALGKTGHVAQIEILYRDINNMVDTLGLNWRSLKAFVDYHERPHRYKELTLEALEEVNRQGEDGPWFEKWCLAELKDLTSLESQLEHNLDEGRVQNYLDKLGQLTRLLREKARLMTKVNEIRRQIIQRKDEARLEAARKAALPKDLADHQKYLRNEYARLLTLLGKAEEAIMLLKSKIASRNAESGKMGAVPTVDAIKRTINKLIAITEKKSTDIALLETQFRKISLGQPSRPDSSSSHQFGTPTRLSRSLRSGSPFATPPTSRSKMMSLSELNRRAMTPEIESTPNGFGLFYTPEGSPLGDKTLAILGDLGDEELVPLREKAKRRRKIANSLEAALLERGVRQTRVSNLL